jgi:SAM-dependent methyltransferase
MPADSHASAGLPPQAVAYQLIFGSYMTRAVHAAAKLGVPDALGGGARTYEEVARVTGTDADRMRRLLRALASLDVVRDLGEGRFELTPVGNCLRSDVPGSLHPFMLLHDGQWWEIECLPDCVKTGRNAYELRHGQAPFAFISQHPELDALFNSAMTTLSAITAPALAQAYDFSSVRRIVDVAGGHGLVLASLLKAYPHLRGILFDTPPVVEGAKPLLARDGVADRCEVVGGDMFESVPAGGDLYLLSHIVHDWNDGPASKILQACRRAMGPETRLLIVDLVLPERVEPDPRITGDMLFDLIMMVSMGGRERSAGELAALLGTAGLRVERVIPTAIPDKVVEAVPV